MQASSREALQGYRSMAADSASLGRYWGSADKAQMTRHPEGDASVRLDWNDGAWLDVSYETHDDALHALARLGFSAHPNIDWQALQALSAG